MQDTQLPVGNMYFQPQASIRTYGALATAVLSYGALPTTVLSKTYSRAHQLK